MTFADEFAAQLRSARRKAGITQEDLGFRADLQTATVSRLECGKSSPRLTSLFRLAGALEIEPAELLPPIRWHPTALGPWVGEWVEQQRREGRREGSEGSESL